MRFRRRRKDDTPPPDPSPVDFYPPDHVVVLHGDWHIEVSPGIRAVTVVQKGTLELRPATPSDPALENHGHLRISGAPVNTHSDEQGLIWLPWFSHALIAGALAPHIWDAMPAPADDDPETA